MTTFVGAILASGLTALAVGFATPAVAAPSGPNDIGGQIDMIADANGWLDDGGMTPYGTYQNDDPRKSASRR